MTIIINIVNNFIKWYSVEKMSSNIYNLQKTYAIFVSIFRAFRSYLTVMVFFFFL